MGQLKQTYLDLIKYCAIPTASGFPLIVTIRSPVPPISSAILMAAPDLPLKKTEESDSGK